MGSYNQIIALSTVSSELLIRLLPNFVWLYTIRSWIVLWYNVLLCSVQSKGHSKCSICSRSRSQQRLSFLTNVHLDDIFLTAEPLITTLSMVVHHHERECHVKRVVCCLQGQGLIEGSCNQNMTFNNIFWTADLMMYHHKLIFFWKKFELLCCVPGQCHCKGSKF